MPSPIPVPFIKRRDNRVLQDFTQIFIGLLDNRFKKTYTTYSLTESSQIKHRAYSIAEYEILLGDNAGHRLLNYIDKINFTIPEVINYSLLERDTTIRIQTTGFNGEYKLSREMVRGLELVETITHTVAFRPASQPRQLTAISYQDADLGYRDSVDGNWEESAEEVYEKMNAEMLALDEHESSLEELLADLEAEAQEKYTGEELNQDGTPMSQQEFNEYIDKLNGLMDSLIDEMGSLDDYQSKLEELIEAGKRSKASAADKRGSGSDGGGGVNLSALTGLLDIGKGNFGRLEGLLDGGGFGGGGGSDSYEEYFDTYFDEYMSDFAAAVEDFLAKETETNSRMGQFFGKQPGGSGGGGGRGGGSRSSANKRNNTSGYRASSRNSTQQATDNFKHNATNYYSVREINVISHALIGGQYISGVVSDIQHIIPLKHVEGTFNNINYEVISYPNTIFRGTWQAANTGSYEVLDRDTTHHSLTNISERSLDILDRDTAYHEITGSGERSSNILDRDTTYHVIVSSNAGDYQILDRDTAYHVIVSNNAGDYQFYTRPVISQLLETSGLISYAVLARFFYERNLINATTQNTQLLDRDTAYHEIVSGNSGDYQILPRDTAYHDLAYVGSGDALILDRDTAYHVVESAIDESRALLGRDTTHHNYLDLHDTDILLYIRPVISLEIVQILAQELILYIREQISFQLTSASQFNHQVLLRDASAHNENVSSQTTHTSLARNTSSCELSETNDIIHEIYYSNHILTERTSVSYDLIEPDSVIHNERKLWLESPRIKSDRSVWLKRQ